MKQLLQQKKKPLKIRTRELLENWNTEKTILLFKCQIENCDNKATHERREVFEFIHRDIKGQMQQIQLCKMKTLLCYEHEKSINAADVTNIELVTL